MRAERKVLSMIPFMILTFEGFAHGQGPKQWEDPAIKQLGNRFDAPAQLGTPRSFREEEAIPEENPLNPPVGLGGPPGGPGGGIGGGMGFGGGRGRRDIFSSSLEFMPRQDFSGGPFSLGVTTSNIRGGVPLWMPGGPIFTASVLHHEFDLESSVPGQNLRLPKTGSLFPDQLTNINFGMITRKNFDNGWSGTLILNFGSASDRPFHSIRELTGGLIGSVLVPLERDAWVFSIFYSPTSQIWFPIPGIAYRWQPNERLTVNLGLPFSIDYRPDDVWSFEASYVPVTNFQARLSARCGDLGSLYLAYLIRNESFFLAGREDYFDRFMIFDQRIVMGWNIPIWKKWSIDLSTGYSFDRFFAEAQDSIPSQDERLNLNSGAFIQLQTGISF